MEVLKIIRPRPLIAQSNESILRVKLWRETWKMQVCKISTKLILLILKGFFMKISVKSFVFCLLMSFVCVANSAEWSQFRGPNCDNHSLSKLPAGIIADGARVELEWQIDSLGSGYSNLAFTGDTIYTLGNIGDACSVIAIDAKTGKTRWIQGIGPAANVGNYPGPRSTPLVTDGKVFAFSQTGDFVALNAKDGKEVWGGDVVKELGGEYAQRWGFASSPILDDEKIILPIGGKDGTLAAFRFDGTRIWRSAGMTDPAPYCSAKPATIHGVAQYILMTNSGVYGIDAANGKTLWNVIRISERPVCSDPLVFGDIVFVSSAYKIGAHAYRVTREGETWSVEKIYENQELQNHHGGMVCVGDHAYFATERNLVCMALATGEIAWSNRCVGKGSISFIDGILIVRGETGEGTIAFVEATPKEYREIYRFDQPDRSDRNSWTYPVVVDGKLYIRDQNTLFCYRIFSQ